MQAIDRRRERQRISKAELADLAGMQSAAIRCLLTPGGRNPTLRTVLAVAEAVNVPLDCVVQWFGWLAS